MGGQVANLAKRQARGVLWLLLAISLESTAAPEVRSVTDRLGSHCGFLQASTTASAFNGVVLIGNGDQIVFEQACGWADADLQVPVRRDHRFRIGSLTKPITASAVLAAVDQGLLALDQPACRWLPACANAWAAVTVRDLLTHTSGIVDHFGDLQAVPVKATATELKRVISALPPDEALLAVPGQSYAYSNFNYVLLGVLLETAAGADWEQALRRLVFEPLALTGVVYDDVHAVIHNRVRGYSADPELGLRNIDYDDHAAFAAGGLLATANQVFRWSRGMLGGRLFSPELVRESLRPGPGDYGYGWQVREFFGRTIYNHSGGIDGFSSHLAHYPDEGLTIVVLSNVENDPAILRACDLAARLFDWPLAVTEEGAEPTPRQRCGIAP